MMGAERGYISKGRRRQVSKGDARRYAGTRSQSTKYTIIRYLESILKFTGNHFWKLDQ